MKLLFVDTRPLRRGAQVFLHDLSLELLKKGVEVKKIYLYHAPKEGSLQLNPQDVVLGGNDTHFFEKFPTVHPLLLRKLVQQINRFAPDAILLNGSRTLKYAAAAKQFIKAAPPIIYRIIDSVKFWNPSKHKQVYYRNLIMPAIDAAVGVSEASLADMKALHGFSKPSVCIHRAIDTEKFLSAKSKSEYRKELNVLPDDRILLLLGNLTRQKRPDRFLQILSEVKKTHPNIKAWIVGDGPLREETESLAKALLLTENISFLGYQSDVIPYVAAADLLLLPSDTEGLPGVVLEAGILEVPTIGNRVGGISECLKDGHTGFIIDKKEDVALFSAKVRQLLDDDDLRTAFGKNARTFILENFGIDGKATEYLTFFQAIRASQKNS